MSRSYLTNCPRCGSRSLENLESYSHCIECLYSPDLNTKLEKRKFLTLREAEELLKAASVHEFPQETDKSPEVAS